MPKREQLYHEPANLKFCMKFQNFNQSRYQNMLLLGEIGKALIEQTQIQIQLPIQIKVYIGGSFTIKSIKIMFINLTQY
ncbi:unnamed protein product, partial [Ceratitis capitata]